MNIARFRADPARVRVSLFRNGRGDFVATVRGRGPFPMSCFGQDRSPQGAIWKAMHEADALGMPGIDLGLQWAYPHPWRGGIGEPEPATVADDRPAFAPTLPSPRWSPP